MRTWKFVLFRIMRQLWARAALYAVFAIAAALLAALFAPFVPRTLAKLFGGGTVNGLLNMLASSLLAVATFSIAAMLTAYTNISQGASPRAAALITGDKQAQGALSTFVGAFLYAAVAYSALGTGYYGNGGRAILFFVTLAVMGVIAVTLLRWLDQLLSFARIGYAIAQVEKTTHAAMKSIFGPASRPCVRATFELGYERSGLASWSCSSSPHLNGIDPQAWLADGFARIASIPQSRLQELLSWEWKRSAEGAVTAKAFGPH